MSATPIAALVGALAGLHTATWGMYKDSLHEGFTWPKYARSVLVGASAGVAIQLVMGFTMTSAAELVLLFGLSYVAERAAVELWKTFVRNEDQSKYFIPMQFAVLGRVVHSRPARAAVGAACIAGLAIVLTGILAFERAGSPFNPVVTALLLGSISGWVSAFGGAWKDAPKEGFQIFKFFRSPTISAGFGLLLAALTTNYVIIAFGALGFTVATIETHKKFGKPLEAPGKFTGTPVRFPDMLIRRRPFARVFAILWVAIVVTMAVALAAPAGLMAGGRLAILP